MSNQDEILRQRERLGYEDALNNTPRYIHSEEELCRPIEEFRAYEVGLAKGTCERQRREVEAYHAANG